MITVDVDEKYVSYQNGSYTMIPTAVVGGNYPVPVATAFDNYSGVLDVETKVYHNYISETGRRSYKIQKDNTFKVDKTGNYTIVYKATDAMGNTSELLYGITAVEQLDDPLAISIDTAAAKVSGVCGEKIAAAAQSVTGGSGDVNVTITATCGETTLDVTKGYFIPEQAGEWTVTYVAKDYAGIEVSTSYTVTVELGTIPVFVDEPVLPKYIVSGIGYTVPTVKANDYSTGTKVELVADMILKDANGETRYKAGETFTPVANAEDPVITLIFTIGGAEYERELPAVMPIQVENGRTKVYIEEMFLGDNYTKERTSDGLKVLAKEEGNFTWMFANAIVAENASITVKGIKGNSNFSAMKVTFTDYADDSIAVTMYVENQANGYARVNFGNLNRELLKGFNLGIDALGNPLDTFVFAYKYGDFYVDSLAISVAQDDQGNPFNGFPSGRVYISTEVVDAQSGAGYYVKQLDNQIISAATADRTMPRIGLGGNNGGMYDLNSTYVVTPALASDTIDATVSAYVTVRNPKGVIITDVNGLTMDKVPADTNYEIKLTEYGQYLVEYSSTDFGGRTGTASYAINVFDRNLPKASIAATWSATAKLGETVVLPEIYISDDASTIEQMKVYRYVRNPFGDAITFGQDYVVTDYGTIKYYRYSFTFNNVGEYTFINVVYDATGNQRIVEYTVTVEA